MNLETFVRTAASRGASDLHLEPGMPPAIRVRGNLQRYGAPVVAEDLHEATRALLGSEIWNGFRRQQSADLAKNVGGVRCRINVLRTARGTALAIRLFGSFQPTIETLNLHPDLARLARRRHGLVLVSGPTGSGKSSTLAALVHEVNVNEAWHVLTLEQPIEFQFRPRKALIRQREVGVDTPSFERGLLDAMREDPDVLMVGEMRDATTMRLTINAAETGHLVLATVHSATVAEALNRIASAFPAEIQPMVCAQLADCLRAVVCQRLVYREDLGIHVPECEILINSQPAKGLVRQGQFFKLQTVLQTGAKDGQFTRDRYRSWLADRSTFHVADKTSGDPSPPEDVTTPVLMPAPPEPATPLPAATTTRTESEETDSEVFVIDPPTGSLSDILDELDDS